MYSFIFNLITNPLGLPIEPLYEYLILIVVNFIAYIIGWKVSPGGTFGSEIHWIVRVLAFLAIWAVLYAIIFVAKLILSNWVIILAVLIGLLVVVGVSAFAIIRWNKHQTKS